MGEEIYEIDPNKCTECIGHFNEPQCVVVCPVECIPVDPAHKESQTQLLARFFLLHPDKTPRMPGQA
jgi:ferredoxin